MSVHNKKESCDKTYAKTMTMKYHHSISKLFTNEYWEVLTE